MVNKAAIVTTTIVAIIAIVGGLFYYSYTQVQVNLNDVKFHSIDWTTFSWSTFFNLGLNALTGNWLGAAFELIDGVNLNLIFGLSNYGILPVYIPDLNYDLFVNGAYVGRGYTNLDATIYPGETREITAFQNFKKSSLTPAISSIVSERGEMYIYVKGTAYFQFLGLSIPVPFESTKQISIIDEIQSRLNSVKQKHDEEERIASAARAAEIAAAANAAVNAASAIGESLYNVADSIINKVLEPPQKSKTYLNLYVPDGTMYVGDYTKIWGNLYWIDGNVAKGVPNAPIVIDFPTKSSNGYLKNIQVTTNSQGYFEFTGKALPKCILYASTWDNNDISKCLKTGYTLSKWGQGKTSEWTFTASYSGDGYRYEPSKIQSNTFYVQINS